jgi:hypothetical protein
LAIAHPAKVGAAKLRVLAALRDASFDATKDPTTAELPTKVQGRLEPSLI